MHVVHLAHGSVHHGVWDGQMAVGDGIQIEGADFTETNSFLSAGGVNKFLKWTLDIGVDDFDISSSFKADLVEATALSFVLWVGDAGSMMHVGLDGHGQHPFREGGAWGDAQTDSGLSVTPLKANTLHTLRLMRTAGVLAVFFDGLPVPGWQSLSFSDAVTAIGWRPWRNTVHVQSLGFLQKNSAAAGGKVGSSDMQPTKAGDGAGGECVRDDEVGSKGRTSLGDAGNVAEAPAAGSGVSPGPEGAEFTEQSRAKEGGANAEGDSGREGFESDFENIEEDGSRGTEEYEEDTDYEAQSSGSPLSVSD